MNTKTLTLTDKVYYLLKSNTTSSRIMRDTPIQDSRIVRYRHNLDDIIHTIQLETAEILGKEFDYLCSTGELSFKKEKKILKIKYDDLNFNKFEQILIGATRYDDSPFFQNKNSDWIEQKITNMWKQFKSRLITKCTIKEESDDKDNYSKLGSHFFTYTISISTNKYGMVKFASLKNIEFFD